MGEKGGSILATTNNEIIEVLKTIAPGTPIREGLENILKAKTGGLIVIGDGKEVMDIADAAGQPRAENGAVGHALAGRRRDDGSSLAAGRDGHLHGQKLLWGEVGSVCLKPVVDGIDAVDHGLHKGGIVPDGRVGGRLVEGTAGLLHLGQTFAAGA